MYLLFLVGAEQPARPLGQVLLTGVEDHDGASSLAGRAEGIQLLLRLLQTALAARNPNI